MCEIALRTGIIVCIGSQKHQPPGCFNFRNARRIIEPVQTERGRIRNQCAEDDGTIWILHGLLDLQQDTGSISFLYGTNKTF